MNTGKISESVLKRSVLKQLKTKRSEVIAGAGFGEDCAFFQISGDELLVSCVQEWIANPADKEEEWFRGIANTVTKAVNNLACAGAEAFAAMPVLILPKEAEESFLKQLVAVLEKNCKEQHIQISGGQTTVNQAIQQIVLTITVYGKVSGEKKYRTQNAKPNQDVIITKWIGLEGTAILARRHEESLCTRYPAHLIHGAMDFDRYLSIVPEAATAGKSDVSAMHDMSRGGVFGALWEMAESAGVGLQIDMKKIPLKQETVEVCEHLGVNPYELLSGGSLILTTDDGEKLVEELAKEQIFAVVVGKTTDKKERVLYNGEEIRFMDRPRGDEIDRYSERKDEEK